MNVSSNDGGNFFECRILAKSIYHAFCEASIINFKDKYLIAYLRDNNRGYKGYQNIYKYISYNGIEWKKYGKLKNIYGHRPTTLLEGDRLFISYRNTKSISLSVMTCIINGRGKEKSIEVIDIDKEIFENKYNYGYTGITKVSEYKNLYYIVYYIQGERESPFIKGCFLKHTTS